MIGAQRVIQQRIKNYQIKNNFFTFFIGAQRGENYFFFYFFMNIEYFNSDTGAQR